MKRDVILISRGQHSWALARSVSHVNGIISKMIEKGGRVENLWQHGGHGEHNLSVFTVRNLQGTYTAHMDGMSKTSLGFDDRVNRFGCGDPPDSSKVKEIEYDPAKIRAQQIERSQGQAIDKGHDYGGFSR